MPCPATAGPIGTEGVGVCHAGHRICSADAWQACSDQVVPSTLCNNLDDDCDLALDENVTQICYTGPANTNGVSTSTAAPSCVPLASLVLAWARSCPLSMSAMVPMELRTAIRTTIWTTLVVAAPC